MGLNFSRKPFTARAVIRDHLGHPEAFHQSSHHLSAERVNENHRLHRSDRFSTNVPQHVSNISALGSICESHEGGNNLVACAERESGYACEVRLKARYDSFRLVKKCENGFEEH